MDLSGVDVLSVLVFFTSLSVLNELVIATEPYQCYGTVCNGGVVEEFCQRNFPFCRPCSDVNKDCKTTHFPQNCTRYCVDYLVRQALDKVPVSCPCPPKLRNGQWQIEQENGCPMEGVQATTHAEFVCHTGFQTVGGSSWRCSFNGTWLSDETGTDHTFPFCSETASSLPLIYAVVILSAVCVCLIIKQIVDYVRRAKFHKLSSKECPDVESQIKEPLLEREKEQVLEIQELEESETRHSVSQDVADQPKDSTSQNENNDENAQNTEHIPKRNDSPASQRSVNVHITLNIEGRGGTEDTIEPDDTSSNEPDYTLSNEPGDTSSNEPEDTLSKELEDMSSYRPVDVCSRPVQETGEVETNPNKDKLMQLSNAIVADIPRLSPSAPSESTVFS